LGVDHFGEYIIIPDGRKKSHQREPPIYVMKELRAPQAHHKQAGGIITFMGKEVTSEVAGI
jgi:hypothetical protein